MNKTKKFNYANDNDFASVVERYGGLELLKEKFPRILQMLYDSRDYHKELERKNTEINSDENKDGHEDDFGISILPIKAQNTTNDKDDSNNLYGVYSASYMSMKEKCPLIMMSGKIYDPIAHKSFVSFSNYEEMAHDLKDKQIIDHRFLDYTKQPNVKTEAYFKAYENKNNKSICTLDKSESRMISIKNMKPVVKSIEVLQPQAKNSEFNLITIVYSNRNDSQAAYIFDNARKLTDTLVTVFFPFHIRITLDEQFIFNPSKPTDNLKKAYIKLLSSVVLGGAVHFDNDSIEKIKVNAEGNVLEIDFKCTSETNGHCTNDLNYWGTNMVLGVPEAQGIFDFHLNFTINYGFKDSGEFDQNADIIVSSEDLPASSNFVKIKPSKIIWGCLGKDTMIRTQKGYSKIDNIRPGDMIFTDKGYIRLKNMITGKEDKIIAVGVDKDKMLLITSEHPIACERGIIRAIDLLSTDKLQTEDGAYKSIYYLDVIDYNDNVFSPELEEPALISANGIMVGDYMTPAQSVKTQTKECAQLDPALVEELKKWHELKLEQF